MRNYLGLFFLFLLNSAYLQGAVVAGFSEGEGTAGVDQFPGLAGQGWQGTWRSELVGDVSEQISVLNLNPLDHGGSYLFVELTNIGSSPEEVSLSRQYGDHADLSLGFSHQIQFDFRADDTYHLSLDEGYRFYDADAPSAAPASETWYIKTATSTHTFHFADGHGDGTYTLVDTGLRLYEGELYRITLTVYPQKQLWEVGVENLDREESVSRENLGFIGDRKAVGGHFHVGTRIGVNDLFRYSLDSVNIKADKGLIPLDSRSQYPQYLGFRPADGVVVEVNPPRFSWAYAPGIIDTPVNQPLREFTLQVADNSDFVTPAVDVQTDRNFYNSLSPLANGLWYWRVGYDVGTSSETWSAVRSFEVKEQSVLWDRTATLTAVDALASKGHPRMAPAEGWASWKTAAESGTHGQTAQQWLNSLIQLANSLVNKPWYVDPDKFFPSDSRDSAGEGLPNDSLYQWTPEGEATQSYNSDTFGDLAHEVAVIAFAHILTGDPAYAEAKNLMLRFAALPHAHDALAWPEYHGGTTKKITRAVEYLAVVYDWYYDQLDVSQKEILLGAIHTRLDQIYLISFSWYGADVAWLYGVARMGVSHPYQNFMWALPALLLTAGDEPDFDAKGLAPMALDFLNGVTASAHYGPDEGINEGIGYGLEKQGTMLRTALFCQLLLPNLNFGKNPYFESLQQWYSHIMPSGIARLPFGDQWFDMPTLRTMNRLNQRIIAHLTQSPQAIQRFQALVAQTGNDSAPLYGFERPWTSFLAETTLPHTATPTTESKEMVFSEGGWVAASSHPPTEIADWEDNVGMLFMCRPRGGYSHSYPAENSFVWFAHGQTLSAGGGSRIYLDPYSQHTVAHNSLLINGKGQEWNGSPEQPNVPYVGRILAYREGENYTHWVGDATRAYQTLSAPGLKRWHRHVLFVDNAWFVIFDDLEMEDGSTPAEFSWLMKLDDQGVEAPVIAGNQIDFTQGNVNGRIVFARSDSELEIVNKENRDGFLNIKNNDRDFYPEAVDILAARGMSFPNLYPAAQWSRHNLWVTNTTPTNSWQLLTTLLAWKEGSGEPTTEVVNSRVMDVSFGGKTKRISFDNAYPGDINIDLLEMRAHAGEEVNLLPQVSALSSGNTSENAGHYDFTITRSDNLQGELPVFFYLYGTAEEGSDWILEDTSPIVFEDGQASRTVRITLIDDAIPEMDETLTLRILPDGSYRLGTDRAEIIISDDDMLSTSNISVTAQPNDVIVKEIQIHNIASEPQHFLIDIERPEGGYSWQEIPYVWEDISDVGTRFMHDVDSGFPSNPVDLGFQFVFYDFLFEQASLHPYGSLLLGHARPTLPGSPLPQHYGAQIAPQMIHGIVNDTTRAYYHRPDSETFIVQLNEIEAMFGGGNLQTFQLKIERNGDIYFYYKTVAGNELPYTTGMQLGTSDHERSMTIAHRRFDGSGLNQDYIKSGLALRIHKPDAFVRVDTGSFTVMPGETQTFRVYVDATGLELGQYETRFFVRSDHPQQGMVTVPVELVVANDAPPSSPVALAATGQGSGTILLEWEDHASSEDFFEIQIKSSGGEWTTFVSDLVANSQNHLVTGLNAESYTFRVRTLNAHGASVWSNEITAHTMPPPVKPTFNQFGNVRSDSVGFSWNDLSSNEEGFRIERKIRNDGLWTLLTLVGANTTDYTDNGLQSGVEYFYRIAAYNAGGISEWTQTEGHSAKTPEPPVAPSETDGFVYAPGKVSLTWTDQSDNESGFSLQRRDGFTGSWNDVASLPANTVHYKDTSAPSGVACFYRIRSETTNGSSVWVEFPLIGTYMADFESADILNGAFQATGSDLEKYSWGGSVGYGGSGGLSVSNNTIAGNRIALKSFDGALERIDLSTLWQFVSTTANGGTPFYLGLGRGSDYAPSLGGSGQSGDDHILIGINRSNTDPSQARILLQNSQDGATVNYNGGWITLNPEHWYRLRVRVTQTGGAYNVWAGVETVDSEGYPLLLATSIEQTLTNSGLSADKTVHAFIGAQGSALQRGIGAVDQIHISPLWNPVTVPEIPKNLMAAPFSGTGISLTWNKPSANTESLLLERSLSPDSGFVEVVTLSADSLDYHDTALKELQTYYYRLRAINTAGYSDWSSVASATTPQSIPLAPNSVQANALSTTAIALSWTDASTNEQGFKLERATGGSAGFALIATLPANSQSYTDAGLEIGTTYQYRLRAFNSFGHSAYSTEVTAATHNTIPAAPQQLSVSAVGSQTLSLQWQDMSSNESYFELQRANTPSGPFTTIQVLNANLVAYTDTALTALTPYYYRLRSGNSEGDSAWTETLNVWTSSDSIPATPQNLRATLLESGRIELSWGDVGPEAVGYRIYRSEFADDAYALIAETARYATSYIDSSQMTVGKTYFYRILAFNDSGQGTWTAAVSLLNPPPALYTFDTAGDLNQHFTATGTAQLNLAEASSIGLSDTRALQVSDFGSQGQRVLKYGFSPGFDTLTLSVFFKHKSTTATGGSPLFIGIGSASDYAPSLGGSGTAGDHHLLIAVTNGTNPNDARILLQSVENGSVSNQSGSYVPRQDAQWYRLQAVITRNGSQFSVESAIHESTSDGIVGNLLTSLTRTFDNPSLANQTPVWGFLGGQGSMRARGMDVIDNYYCSAFALPSAPELSALESWRLQHFGSTENTGNAADDADPDSDGIVNLLEYALGGDPWSAGSATLPTLGVLEADGSRLYLTVSKNAEASDLAFVVEVSPDLHNWFGSGGHTYVIEETSSTLIIGDSTLLNAENPRRFMRLRVWKE